MINEIKKEEFQNTIFESLLEIPDCPKKLNFQGNLFPKDDYKFIAVVGSRGHSSYAKNVLEKLFKEISGQPIVIISGLALGIDALAHSEAIKNNLKTIAIPGSGLNEEVLYPKSNLGLARNILDNNGILISEFENSAKTMPYFFPQRNRIMAGMADLILVIEAQEKSGTLITARLALNYNKELATIPNSIFSDYSIGSNNLLKQGAFPVFSGQDILELLNLTGKVKQTQLNFDDLNENEK
ncbi:MAG TPA: DNA-protecting protein DprA, partial [Candidatus Pacebacteria bacterium]|nr:DNA-protecting protein DprA [Candidatus Paceibacterota bacterium]